MKIPLFYLLRQAQRESVIIAGSIFDVDLKPDAWEGMASDGRELSSLLDAIPYRALHTLGNGGSVAEAIASGDSMTTMLTKTQLADASRSATQTAMAADEKVRGYIRHVNLPACARCIILAGRFYRWSDGFLRHPGCDCSMDPIIGDGKDVVSQDPERLFSYMRDEYPARIRKSVTESDLKALDHGADLNQVVNAHRGMTRTTPYGREVQATTEGTTRRGYAGSRLIAEGGAKSRPGSRYKGARTPRLTPDEIFKSAERNGWAREEVVRQLTRFGYI